MSDFMLNLLNFAAKKMPKLRPKMQNKPTTQGFKNSPIPRCLKTAKKPLP